MNIFENYLLKVMSMQSFRFIRLEDKKLIFGGERGGGGGRKELTLRNQRTWKSSWRMGPNKPLRSLPTKVVQWIARIFLRDLFFAKHFLLFRYIAYHPWVFYYKKESLNSASSYQKDFNTCCCHYNSIKRKMTGLFYLFHH